MGQLTRFTVLTTLLLTTAALADKNVDEARVRFKRGTEFYDEGNYRGALVEFERAHQALPNYKMLYNIGQVYLQLLDYARAQDAFSRYLKEGGSDLGSSRRDEVNRELERLKTRVGRIAVVTADGAEVLIDDESVGMAPLSAPVSANTGRHKVTVNPPGRAAITRVVDVAGLETTTLTLGREEPVVTPPAPVVSSSTPVSTPSALSLTRRGPVVKSKTPMLLGWVATGALAAAGGVLAGVAFGNESSLAKAKATLGVTQLTLDQSAARVSTFGTAADVFGIAAVVAAGISVAMTVSFFSTDDVTVSVGPTGLSVFARF